MHHCEIASRVCMESTIKLLSLIFLFSFLGLMTNLWKDDRKSVVQIENSSAIRICVRNPLILSLHNSLDSLSFVIAIIQCLLIDLSI